MSEREWSPPVARASKVVDGEVVDERPVQIGDGGNGLVILRAMAAEEGQEPEEIGVFTVEEIMLAMFESDPVAFAAAMADAIEYAEQLVREQEEDQ